MEGMAWSGRGGVREAAPVEAYAGTGGRSAPAGADKIHILLGGVWDEYKINTRQTLLFNAWRVFKRFNCVAP